MTQKRPRTTRRAGFTLMEVLVAMTIFGVGVLGVVTSLSLATQSNGSARRLAAAAHLAERHMAEAVAVKGNALSGAEGMDGVFRWRTTYQRKTNDLILATLSVEWEDRGETQVFELNQLFTPKAESG